MNINAPCGCCCCVLAWCMWFAYFIASGLVLLWGEFLIRTTSSAEFSPPTSTFSGSKGTDCVISISVSRGQNRTGQSE